MTDTIFRTLPEQIASHLRQDIISGRLRPDTPLREQELSERFGVSRGPIREVFRQLTQQGLLVTEANKGVRVASQPSPNVRDLIRNLRLEIETFVITAITGKVDAEDLVHTSSILDQIKLACEQEDPDTLTELDLMFHQSILNLYEGTEIIALWLPIVLRMMLDYQRHGELIESYYEHKRILEAIITGNTTEAIAALQDNIK